MFIGGGVTLSVILQLNDKQKTLYGNIYSTLSTVMLNYYTEHKDKTFTVLLSGGYDSRFVLYLCKDLNIPISRCYTFSLENKLSTDAKLAKAVCDKENVELEIVNISVNADSIITIMEDLATNFNCVKKTDFECVLPLYCLWKNIKEDVILMGTDSDNYFALGKKYALHFKNLPDGLTKYKEHLWGDPNDGQIQQKALLDSIYNKQMFDVFNTKEVYNVFENTTWDELNKPFRKGPLYCKFADRYDEISPYRSSYQCGDSGVRELCADVLLHSKYNVDGKYTSVIGCYNEIRRQINAGNSTTTSKQLYLC